MQNQGCIITSRNFSITQVACRISWMEKLVQQTDDLSAYDQARLQQIINFVVDLQ